MMTQDFYDQVADEFMGSIAGQMTGISRVDFLEKLKKHEPDVEAFRERMEAAKRIIQSKLDDMQRSASAGQPLPSHLDLSEAEALLRPNTNIQH